MHETSFQALDSTLLTHIGDLNRELLELLAATARGQETGLRSPLVQALHEHWLRLQPEALRNLAECPYLLLELIPASPQDSRPPAGIREPAAQSRQNQAAAASGPLTELTRRALLMAWHYAQTNPVAARITLGLTGTDCANLAALPLSGLERLVVATCARQRLRWEERGDIWRQLLEAAAAGTQGRLRQLQLRGLQLLAAQNLR